MFNDQVMSVEQACNSLWISTRWMNTMDYMDRLLNDQVMSVVCLCNCQLIPMGKSLMNGTMHGWTVGQSVYICSMRVQCTASLYPWMKCTTWTGDWIVRIISVAWFCGSQSECMTKSNKTYGWLGLITRWYLYPVCETPADYMNDRNHEWMIWLTISWHLWPICAYTQNLTYDLLDTKHNI